jgi:Glycosyltransferases involved in cell wall biogenesis
MENQKLDYSIVCSVYNEAEGIEAFYEALKAVLDGMPEHGEVLFVNDGSNDGTLEILRRIAGADARVRVLSFARNFGHEAAMTAGIDHSRGDFVICMDSDLQHPPTLIPEMVGKARAGFDVINMVRTDRLDATRGHNLRSRLFYKFSNLISDIHLPENASDFFLISRAVANVLKKDYRERTRFLRGIVQLVGFSHTTLEYVAPARVAGKSKYSFRKLMGTSLTALSSFSKMPLRLGIFVGIIFGIISLLLIIYSLVMWVMNTPVSGYTTIVVFLSAFASLQFFLIGLIGQYVGYIFDEVKGRPIYVVQEIIEHEGQES